MAEYIEREALLNRIKTLQETESATVGKKQFADGYFLGLDEAEIIAMQAPAADVVEVVRCKDCQYYEPFATGCDEMVCGLDDLFRNPVDFCSNGERRSE